VFVVFHLVDGAEAKRKKEVCEEEGDLEHNGRASKGSRDSTEKRYFGWDRKPRHK